MGCFFSCFTDKGRPDALVSSYWTFQRLLSLRSFVYFPSSTVKPPRDAAYDATLAERRAERWASAYLSSRKKAPYIFFMTQQPLVAQGLIIEASQSITLRHSTLGTTPLDEWSARRKHLYLTTNNTHKRQTSMLPAGFEPTIPASEWPQAYALDRAAIGKHPI